MKRAKLLPIATAFIFVACVASADEPFGAWSFSISDDEATFAASTVNDSGETLAEICTPKQGSCLWLIAMSTGCEKDHKYPVLANADTGAVQLEIACSGETFQGKHTYFFTNFDQVDSAIKMASLIGFAIPLESDRFRVVRFSLNGSTQAIASMREAATKATSGEPQHKARESDTKDQDI